MKLNNPRCKLTLAKLNNQTDLNRLQVPFVDDLKAQRGIVAYLDSVRAQAAALKRAHEDTDAELRRLEQAILDRAFRGEL